MTKFEGVQKLILESKNKNDLVSAGAGSGKTTIMIQKIANLLIEEKVDVDSLLVVTFTVLAAQEMKDRLIEKMQEELIKEEQNTDLISNLIEKIKTASIDTIDGFSSKTIKKYFYNLEISPNIEIISDSTRDYYLTKAMKRTIEDFSKQADKINLMIDIFGGKQRNTKMLEDAILNIYYKVVNLQDYDSFLQGAIKEYSNSIKSERVVNNFLCSKAKNLEQFLMYNYSNLAVDARVIIQDSIDQLQNINSALSLKSNLLTFKALNLSAITKKQAGNDVDVSNINDEIKAFKKSQDTFIKTGIDEDFEEKNEKIVEILSIFIDLLQNFIKNYNDLKKKNNLIDFNDLNRLMLKLLENDAIKQELQNKYKYVFIDEYQDVNPLQDSLMSKIVGPETKLFMVGDVKQSIYGFRGASPEWFLDKYNKFKQDKLAGEAFDMNVNFRSSPVVLNFINEIFAKLMTKSATDIDYVKDCIIEPKRTDIVDDKVKILLVKENEENSRAQGVYSVKNHTNTEKLNTTMAEAMLVSNIITNLIGTEFYDAKLKQVRKMKFGDIAILSRSEKDASAQILIEHLKSQSIPLNLTNKLEVKENECIKLILSILKCVVGSADDVDYLATFMAITNLDINNFIEIRNTEESLFENLLKNKETINEISLGFEILEDIGNASYTTTNAELIKYILDDKKLRYSILRKAEGLKELNILEEFVSKLSTTENNLNLAEFIEVVESNVSSGGDFDSTDNDDSVVFQTIHKSKGLEYPVVILFNASKQFQYINEHDGINFNADLGLGMDFYDTVNRIKTYSVPKYAIRLKNLEKGNKEELRLLYVALTRAKNKLFITGSYDDKIFSKTKLDKHSFLNMILNCYLGRLAEGHNEFDFCEIDFIDNVQVKKVDTNSNYSNIEQKGMDFVYSQTNKFEIPFKNTVTGINSQKSQEMRFETKKWTTPMYQYNAEEDKALVGTHYHKALELLDLSTEYVKNTDFKDVDYKKIEKAHSILSGLAKGAITRKEAEFMMYVPYNEIVESEITDKVLVQGVVDLIIERENSIDIVDYKFSSLSARVLKEKYKEQLLLYKQAVESAFGKKVENMYIYSINNAELI